MAKITKLCASSLSLGTSLGQMNCLKVRKKKSYREKAKNNVQILNEKMNLHQRKKGKTHMQFFFPHSFCFLYVHWFRAAGRRWRHILILHAEK